MGLSKYQILSDVDSITALVKDSDGHELALTADGEVTIKSIVDSVVVTATALDIRALTSSDVVSAVQSGTWDIGTLSTITNVVHIDDNSGSLTVDATNLDIRDLTQASDSVAIGDGTTIVSVDPTTHALKVDGSLTVDDRQNVANLAGAVSMTDVAAAIPASPLANRERIIIQNISGETVAIGPSGVTYGSGLLLPKGDSIELWAGPSNVIYGICNTSKTASLRVLELS